MKNQKGFTLIELLIVVIIIGILAAYAVPKYMALDREARIAVTKGLKGSIHAASDMVHAIAVMRGFSGPGALDIGGGHNVEVAANLYPTGDSDGIARALADASGFDMIHTVTETTFRKKGAADPSNCKVTYANLGTAGSTPVIVLVITGC